MKLENHVVFITGGASGIGLALARELLERHNTVIVSGRNPSKLAEAKRNHPRLHTLESDATAAPQSKGAIDSIVGQFGRLTMLVNNAGVMRSWDVLHENDAAHLEEVARKTVRGMARDQFEIPIGESRMLRIMERIAPALIEQRLLGLLDRRHA
jgi:short-subunit dehydrogenase involved in D-alanine esterification of teichoic acids